MRKGQEKDRPRQVTNDGSIRVKDKILFSRDLATPNASECVTRAVESEKQGFDQLWAPDHMSDIPPPNGVFDAWTVLAYAGAKTKRIRLSPGVTDVQRIHPAKTANIAATLDQLTGGRVCLGLGAGEVMNTRPYGIPWESVETRVERLREAVKVIKLLWASSLEHPVSFEGKFYRLDNARLDAHPVMKDVPVYIGALFSSRMFDVIGEVGDGWFPGSFFTPRALREKVSMVRDSARRHGRDPNSIDFVVNLPIVITRRRDVRDSVRNALKREISMNRYLLRIFEMTDHAGRFPKELEYQLAPPTAGTTRMIEKVFQNFPLSDSVVDGFVDEAMAVGSLDHCLEKIAQFVKAGATQIYASSMTTSRRNYELIGAEVIPQYRNE